MDKEVYVIAAIKMPITAIECRRCYGEKRGDSLVHFSSEDETRIVSMPSLYLLVI